LTYLWFAQSLQIPLAVVGHLQIGAKTAADSNSDSNARGLRRFRATAGAQGA
jgi:hypothetical protein